MDNKGKHNVNKTIAVDQQQETKSNRNWIVAIIVTLLVVFLVAMSLMLVADNVSKSSRRTTSQIQGNSTMHIGESQQLTVDTDVLDINNGALIKWYVNDVKVQESRYKAGNTIQYLYTPNSVGTNHIKVEIGKDITKYIAITVERPVLKVSVSDYTLTYGQPLPTVKYSVSGYVEGYGAPCPQSGSFELGFDYAKVGQYQLYPDKPIVCEGYDISIVSGTLTVLPAKLSITADNINKQYDGTTNIIADWQLIGVIKGDDVQLCSDGICFQDKNVGENKAIDLSKATLIGADSENYVIDTANTTLNGQITPKHLQIVGISAHDKNYDGTDKVQLNDVGKLEGVIEGDIVEIGSIQAKLQDAKSGKGKVVDIDSVTLVGSDKANYVVDKIENVQINVFVNYMNILLNRPNIILGNG